MTPENGIDCSVVTCQRTRMADRHTHGHVRAPGLERNDGHAFRFGLFQSRLKCIGVPDGFQEQSQDASGSQLKRVIHVIGHGRAKFTADGGRKVKLHTATHHGTKDRA